jgi:alcohol dehydrogenase class IV
MATFTFNSVTRVVFGAGTFKQAGTLAAEFGHRALIVSNADRSGERGLMKQLIELLRAAHVTPTVCGLAGEPTVADTDRCVEAARNAGCDVVIGIGGGSAVDCAKAVACLLSNGGGALDYMEVVGKGQPIKKCAAAWIAIPTTAGTGAEVTRNAVIGSPEHRFKASLRSEGLLARVALVDPELHIGVRPDITARTGMDALTQCIEAYTSKNANPLSDPIAREGIRRAARSLQRAYANGEDLAAREDMALAALFSGIALTNAGLGAVHGFAAPMGARFPIPHGTVCAILLPHCTRANVALARILDGKEDLLARYAEIACFFEPGAEPERLAELLAELNDELEIPSLAEFGVTEADIPDLVTAAQKANSMKTNPVTLVAETLEGILRAAL